MMKAKLCRECGEPFDMRYKGQTKCPACAEKGRKKVMLPRTCVDCGSTFIGGPSAKRCPPCRAVHNREREKLHKKRGVARPLGSTDFCTVCGKPYTVTGGLQKYCPDCAVEAIKAQDRKRGKEYAKEYAPRRIRKTESMCVVCGKATSSDVKYCSEECRRKITQVYQNKADVKRGKASTLLDFVPFPELAGVTATYTSHANMQRVCEMCGKGFVGGIASKFCPECRKARNRDYARRRYGWTEEEIALGHRINN